MNEDTPTYAEALAAYGRPDPTRTKLDTSLEACVTAGRVRLAVERKAS